MEIDRLIGTYGIYACTVLSLAFVLFYCLWARPWRTEYGRLILFSNTVLGLLFLFLSLRTVFDNTFTRYARIILFVGGVPVYLAWQLWLLYRIQKRGK